MSGWIFMAVPFYITYYTLMFAYIVWKKEKNILACIFIVLLALSIFAVPLWMKLL